jgi:H+/Cl- antiporter ClcA
MAASLSGFRGGLVFPLMFVGGVGGLALAQVAPGIPAGFAVGCGMAATGVAMFVCRSSSFCSWPSSPVPTSYH